MATAPAAQLMAPATQATQAEVQRLQQLCADEIAQILAKHIGLPAKRAVHTAGEINQRREVHSIASCVTQKLMKEGKGPGRLVLMYAVLATVNCVVHDLPKCAKDWNAASTIQSGPERRLQQKAAISNFAQRLQRELNLTGVSFSFSTTWSALVNWVQETLERYFTANCSKLATAAVNVGTGGLAFVGLLLGRFLFDFTVKKLYDKSWRASYSNPMDFMKAVITAAAGSVFVVLLPVLQGTFVVIAVTIMAELIGSVIAEYYAVATAKNEASRDRRTEPSWTWSELYTAVRAVVWPFGCTPELTEMKWDVGESEIPLELACIFCFELPYDPVEVYGKVYERRRVRAWIEQHGEDPYRQRATVADMKDLSALKTLLHRYAGARGFTAVPVAHV